MKIKLGKTKEDDHKHRNYFVDSADKMDVVCGMRLENTMNTRSVPHNGTTYYFCGEECEKRFVFNPERFQSGPLIRLDNVCKNFMMGATETRVLRGLNLNIWEGDFIAIVGSSGSGKSTALNMMGLLDIPTEGKIYLRGIDTSLVNDEEKAFLRSETFGFVFQQYNLVPWLTAYENIILPRIFANKPFGYEEIKELMAQADLDHRMDHRPFEMSGGEQQRVALLRALVNNPKIILADEPTGNLDSITGKKILNMLVEESKKRGKTLVIITHDHSIAEQADEVITLKDGRVEQDQHKKYYA